MAHPRLTVATKEPGYVFEPAALENAADDLVGMPFGIERVDIGFPEEPSDLLRQSAHGGSLAHDAPPRIHDLRIHDLRIHDLRIRAADLQFVSPAARLRVAFSYIDMSRTFAILLGLALVWLTAWSIAGYYMREAGSEMLAQAEHLRAPAARLERGADVRVEGTIVGDASAVSPYRETKCVAAVANIFVTGSYQDIHDRTVWENILVARRQVGPPNLEFAVGAQRLLLPLERWAPHSYSRDVPEELPQRLGVTPEELAAARAKAQGTVGGYAIDEATIDPGARFLLVGRLEHSDGPLRLEADPVLGRVVLFPGTQQEFVQQMSGSGGGLRVAGWILGAGLGPLPLAILGLVWLARRKSAASAAPQG